MRKALVVGINNYPSAPLRGCINDASAFATIMETHGNGDPNFDVRLYTDVPTRAVLTEYIQNLFNGENEISLFYFSGHGFENEIGTHLVTPDAVKLNVGVSMDELLIMANNSRAKNKIIILDCCHSGAAGTSKVIGGITATITKGVTILTASKEDESAMEVNGHGVFTNLLIDALQGGAADIKGDITPGSIYAYIDQALGAWEQRPVFKTNITEFTSLRNMTPRISKDILRKIVQYFPSPSQEFALDPSYEYTNSNEIEHNVIEPYAKPENVEVFKELQKLQGVGLVVPVGTPHMYFAAMEFKSCRLTALGYHYWRLANKKRL